MKSSDFLTKLTEILCRMTDVYQNSHCSCRFFTTIGWHRKPTNIIASMIFKKCLSLRLTPPLPLLVRKNLKVCKSLLLILRIYSAFLLFVVIPSHAFTQFALSYGFHLWHYCQKPKALQLDLIRIIDLPSEQLFQFKMPLKFQ